MPVCCSYTVGDCCSNVFVLDLTGSIVDLIGISLLVQQDLQIGGAFGLKDRNRNLVVRHVGVYGSLETEQVLTVGSNSLHSGLRLVSVVGAEQGTDAVYEYSAHCSFIIYQISSGK